VIGQKHLKYYEAIAQAIDVCMARDENVYIMGLGVPDPSGIFGTTVGLQEKYGVKRVMDTPTSENAMTGIAIGSAIAGMRPIMTHHRVEFALLAMEPLINQAAKWRYVFGGNGIPLVVRMIIGRGWGQGPQHSQALQALFAHIPGLKVVLPSSAYDAKGMLISAVEDNNPVIFIEHRWLYNLMDDVPDEVYKVPLGQSKVVREGSDVTITAISYAMVEAVKAALVLESVGISTEVLDLRTLRPLDRVGIINSIKKTGRLVAIDLAWNALGTNAEVLAVVAESPEIKLKATPVRLGLNDSPTPASAALAGAYYPKSVEIVEAVCHMMDIPLSEVDLSNLESSDPVDVPDQSFTGPF
jgi:acetoin:2,6-dichlorophenolindophenol oxidoreductase subunit beta